jgi:hypothetical protein
MNDSTERPDLPKPLTTRWDRRTDGSVHAEQLAATWKPFSTG